MRGLPRDVVDRRAQLFGGGGDALHAGRRLVRSLGRRLDADIGLRRHARHAVRGGSHLARGVAELMQRAAYLGLEFADIAFDGVLAGRGAGIALALLLLDPRLLDRLLLDLASAPASAPISS